MRRLASCLLIGVALEAGACADAHSTDAHSTDIPDASAATLPVGDATLPVRAPTVPANDAALSAGDATLTAPDDAASPGFVVKPHASSTPPNDAGPSGLDAASDGRPCCGPDCAPRVTDPSPCGCSVRSGGAYDVVQQPLACGCRAGDCPDNYQDHLNRSCSDGVGWTGAKGCGKVVVSPAQFINGAADYIFDADSGKLVGHFVASDVGFGTCCTGVYLYGAGAFRPSAWNPDSHECAELTPCAVCGVDAGALPACFSAPSRRP